VQLGVSFDSVQRVCPGSAVIAGTDEEGQIAEYGIVRLTSGDTLVASLEPRSGAKVVRNVSVQVRGVRSSLGIGVGSEVADLRQKAASWRRGVKEGLVYIWTQPDDGVSYRLSANYDALEESWAPEGLAGIADSVTVTEILVRGVEGSPSQ